MAAGMSRPLGPLGAKGSGGPPDSRQKRTSHVRRVEHAGHWPVRQERKERSWLGER